MSITGYPSGAGSFGSYRSTTLGLVNFAYSEHNLQHVQETLTDGEWRKATIHAEPAWRKSQLEHLKKMREYEAEEEDE